MTTEDHRLAVLAAFRDGPTRALARHVGRAGLTHLMGQAAPRPSRRAHYPLLPNPAGSAGGRLWKMSGWSLAEFINLTVRHNTLPHWPGASSKGDLFPVREAREHAAARTDQLQLRERCVIFVGRLNASLYVWPGEMPPPFTWVETSEEQGRWAWIVHTSGVVAFWNNSANRARCRTLFASEMDRMRSL